MVVVAGQSNGDAFLLRPGFLRERVVAADADDGGAGEVGEAFGDRAEFISADAGVNHGEKEQDDVLALVVGKFDQVEAIGVFRGKGEVGSGGSSVEHMISLVELS